MADNSGSLSEPGSALAQRQIPRLTRPSMQELPKVHQELGLWMARTRYQVQPMDRIPIWRVQNTSLCLSTGAAVGSFFLLKRFRPSLKFPLDVVPPFVMFYLTHRAMQVWQLPGLYDAFLSLSSPLGFKAREILENVRSNGPLPSHEFSPTVPGQRAAQLPPAAAPSQVGGPEAFPGGSEGDSDAGSGVATSIPSFPSTSAPDWASSPAKPASDPWVESSWGGGAEATPSQPAWDAGDTSWGTSTDAQNTKAPQSRRTWDEIRAANAARQQ